MNSCPVNLFDPDVQENWYPAYDQLREHEPVFQIPGTTVFVLTRYEDIVQVVRDLETYSNQPESHGGELLIQHQEARDYYVRNGLGKDEGKGRWTPLGIDPPVHRKYRQMVDKFFQGAALTRARPMIEELVTRLIDDFADKGEVEFNSAFAEPLPVLVITRLIGFPEEDIPQLKSWSASWAKPFERELTLEQEMKVARDGVDFQNYIKAQVDLRRKNPKEDILTHLANARFDDSRPLTDHEIASMVDNLYIGGNETTTFALTSGLWQFLRDPEVYRALLADPSKIKTAVEENLRLESPTQGLYRTAVKDTEIGGVAVPKGSTIHIRFAAGNRDPRMFACPERLDLERRNAGKHLAFSVGEHHCPGSALSRLEQVVAFEEILKRCPNLRLFDERNDYRHHPGFVLRALRELHLAFDPVKANSFAGGA